MRIATARLDEAILAYLVEMEWVDARTISAAVGASHGKTFVRCQILRERGALASRWQTAEEARPGCPPRVLFRRPPPA